MSAGTKVCPFCGESIKTVAVICRYCNHEVPPETASAAAAHPVSGLEVEDIADLLSGLVDRSLVVLEDVDGTPRYRLLETVREYARGRLRSLEGEHPVRDRHSTYFATLAEDADRRVRGRDHQQALAWMVTETDNLRAALDWGLTGEDSPNTALSLVGSLSVLWMMKCRFSEGWQAVESVLPMATTGPPLLLADAFQSADIIAFWRGDYERAREYCAKALDCARLSGDPWRTSKALFRTGILALEREDMDEAQAAGDEGLVLARPLGDEWLIAKHLAMLGLTAWNRGDIQAARQYLQEGLDLDRRVGAAWYIGMTLATLGMVTDLLGDGGTAGSLHMEGLGICRRLKDSRGMAWHLIGLAGVAITEEQPERAARLMAAADAQLDAIGSRLPSYVSRSRQRALDRTLSLISRAVFDSASSEGARMTLGQAVRYALREEPTTTGT